MDREKEPTKQPKAYILQHNLFIFNDFATLVGLVILVSVEAIVDR